MKLATQGLISWRVGKARKKKTTAEQSNSAPVRGKSFSRAKSFYERILTFCKCVGTIDSCSTRNRHPNQSGINLCAFMKKDEQEQTTVEQSTIPAVSSR